MNNNENDKRTFPGSVRYSFWNATGRYGSEKNMHELYILSVRIGRNKNTVKMYFLKLCLNFVYISNVL